VTQPELRELADLQAAEWKLNRAVMLKATSVERRLQEGAIQEDGALEFDRELAMARRPGVKAG
jgi:hypothetical protein